MANDTLRKVWLNSNPLGPAGVRAIATSLCSNDTLLSVNLSNTMMTRGKQDGYDKYDHQKYKEDLSVRPYTCWHVLFVCFGSVLLTRACYAGG